ncbi:MAG TPA: helix-turn-helix domain-containing protein [Candidatus Limnocylindria bacterium]|nr:helix-turn-helix domain-containing protein [Candidatus Limnocylindria bacterium]
MRDQDVGAAVRAVRIRRGLRQFDVAAAAGMSAPTVSRIERGHLEEVGLSAVRTVSGVLDIKVDVVVRWRGAELARMFGRRHAGLHEALARNFAKLTGWRLLAEVSFSIYGERGTIDALAWHAATRSLVVIELKTEIVDVQGLLGAVDRYGRLARTVARDRGFNPLAVSVWVVLADGRSNRRALADHVTLLRGRFPVDGRGMRRWLRDPRGEVSALTFLPYGHVANAGQRLSTPQRVRTPRRPT